MHTGTETSINTAALIAALPRLRIAAECHRAVLTHLDDALGDRDHREIS
jgi:hypothetical protein